MSRRRLTAAAINAINRRQQERERRAEDMAIRAVEEALPRIWAITDPLLHEHGVRTTVDVVAHIINRYDNGVYNGRIVSIPEGRPMVFSDLSVDVFADESDPEDDAMEEDPAVNLRQVQPATLHLGDELFTQPMIEERINQVTERNQHLEYAHANLPQVEFDVYVDRLGAVMQDLDDYRVRYGDRFDLQRNASCIFSLYTFYVLEWTLCTYLSRLRENNRLTLAAMYRELPFDFNRLHNWAACSHLVVQLVNRHGLLMMVIPERFILYKIINRVSPFSRRHVQELLQDEALALMAFHIRHDNRFAKFYDVFNNNTDIIYR